MTTRNRPQLKAFFVKNAIPTASNFADLIDSQLNQAEDGVFKTPGDSLALVAAGDSRRVLRLFGAPPPAAADWQLSLSPPQTANTPGSARTGLGISDAGGNLRLFIDGNTGNLGVGTNNPGAPLDVRVPGVANSDRLLVDAVAAWDGVNRSVTLATANAGPLNLYNPHVPWIATESRASIRFGRSGGTASGHFWDVGTRVANAFSISLNGSSDPKLAVLADGNVGIGTSNPLQRLDVAGNTNITGALTVTGTATAQTLVATGNIQAASVGIAGALSANTFSVGTITANAITVNNTLAAGALIAGTSVNAASVSANTVTAATLNATTATITTLAAPTASLGQPTRFGISVTRSNQKVSLPTLPASLAVSTGIVIQAWVYIDFFENGARILEFGNTGSPTDNISLFVNSSAQLCCQYYVNGQVSPLVASAGGALKNNMWQFVVLTISDTGAVRLLINNAQVATGQHQPLRNVQRSENILCESIAGGPLLLSGAVTELSIWIGSLTSFTSAPLVGNEAKLAGYWRLNGGTANACMNQPNLGPIILTFVGESIAPTFQLFHEKTQQVAIAGETWTPINPPAGWTATIQLAYFKDALGMVHLRGSMAQNNSQPAVTGIGFLPTTLPIGYRPQTIETHLIATFNGVGRVNIQPDGYIDVNSGHTWQTCLDGIHFRAGG